MGRPTTLSDLELAPTLILFGVSGVGKTTAATRMLERFPAWLHFQASTLLRSALNQSGESLRTAEPKQIASNQHALAAALAGARASFPGRPVIIDAHSVIDNDETLVPLPLETFSALQPIAIAFLAAPAEEISRRRKLDPRGRPSRNAKQISAYQDLAEVVARDHARTLGVPFVEVVSPNLEPLYKVIEQISDTWNGFSSQVAPEVGGD